MQIRSVLNFQTCLIIILSQQTYNATKGGNIFGYYHFFADSFFLELSKELLINVIVAVAVHKFLSHSDKSAH